ncbi:MAG: TonB-dependent receptor plug domain-containing protein [Deltaproteobacteria bacterium]|nr:TonB-dependent receptor plug domain-containing protein [Deltaproteobacteria bacterium]
MGQLWIRGPACFIFATMIPSLVTVSPAHGTDASQPVEIYVWGEQPRQTATERIRTDKDLELRPGSKSGEVMHLAPGLVTGQHHGGGKADQILFRGFDSDHGTDFAVFVDGIPVNMVSHGHGQGYADLHWLIGETVDRVEIYKGPYFPQFGDFATSGAMNIVTKQRDKDSSFTMTGGSYNTQRYLALFSPPEGTPLKPYIALESYYNDGPFKSPNDYNRYNVFSKFTLLSTASSNLAFLGTFYKTYWDASGQIPERAVNAGAVGRFGSVDPSEGGNSSLENLGLIYNYADASQSVTAQTWAAWYDLQLWSNFTFFLHDPEDGDGIEQTDRRFLAGNNISYRRNSSFWTIPGETLVGFSSRYDHIRVRLYHQKRRERLSVTTNNLVRQTNLGWYAQQELRPTSWLRSQIGVRMDNFFFDVDQVGSSTQIISGREADSLVNPKLNFVFTPFRDTAWQRDTRLFLSFGGGYHSNDARVVVSDKTKKPLPRYLAAEIGWHTNLWERFDLTVAFWRSHLESELVFAGDEGTFEPSGRSKRQGIETEIRYEILPWLSYDVDLSYTWAKFAHGDAVPLAPRLLAQNGLTVRHSNGLRGRFQIRHVGSRYGLEDRSVKTQPYTLLDFVLKYVWGRYELFLTLENLANTKWRSAETIFESRLRSEPKPVLDSHFTPGDPFTAKAGITLHFW